MKLILTEETPFVPCPVMLTKENFGRVLESLIEFEKTDIKDCEIVMSVNASEVLNSLIYAPIKKIFGMEIIIDRDLHENDMYLRNRIENKIIAVYTTRTINDTREHLNKHEK